MTQLLMFPVSDELSATLARIPPKYWRCNKYGDGRSHGYTYDMSAFCSVTVTPTRVIHRDGSGDQELLDREWIGTGKSTAVYNKVAAFYRSKEQQYDRHRQADLDQELDEQITARLSAGQRVLP